MLSKFPEMLNFYFEFIYLIKPKLSKSDEIIHNNISGNHKSKKKADHILEIAGLHFVIIFSWTIFLN